MPPSGDHVVRVSEIPGSRWDLALDQLADAGAMTVLDCEPPVGLQRDDGWPGADRHIHLSIFTSLEPGSLTAQIATNDVTTGVGHLAGVIDADPRLAALFEEYGVVRAYVYNYGHGAVKVADVSDDGTVTLL